MHHKGSKYTNAARDAELKASAKLGDYLCNQIDVWRAKQGKAPYTSGNLKTNATNARGDDYDRRQMIADLISDDATPFGPDDEESLRYMPDKTLRALRDQFLGARTNSRVSAPRMATNAEAEVLRAMSHEGDSDNPIHRAIANSRAENERRQARALEYCRRNPVGRPAMHANSADESVAAMSQNVGAVEFLRRQREGK